MCDPRKECPSPVNDDHASRFHFVAYDELPQPSGLRPVCRLVLRLIRGCVSMANQTFDWERFQQTIDRQSSHITLDLFDDQTINQAGPDVEAMVNKISSYLTETYGGQLADSDLRAKIRATFTNPKLEREYGFPWFSSTTKGFSSGGSRYQVFFALPSDNPDEFIGVVATVKLTATIGRATSFWGLRSSISDNFAAHIIGVRLIVNRSLEMLPDYVPQN